MKLQAMPQPSTLWPLATQVRRILLDDISRGEYPEGSRLPPERDLALRLQVSRKTVRAALAELETAGRISRHVGRGTFVRPLRQAAERPRRPFAHVGIVFFKYTDPHRDLLTARLFEGMEEVLRESSIVSTIYGLTCVQGNDYEALASDVAMTGFDAVIVSPEPAAGSLGMLSGSSKLVQVGYFLPECGGSYVGGDIYAGMRKAVRHLAGLGHRRYGLLTSMVEREAGTSSIALTKVRAFEEAVREVGSSARVFWRSEAAGVLEGAGRPTAVVTSETGQARGLLERARSLGVRIPEELSLVSFDDGDIGETTAPRFTGIRVLSRAIGVRGAEVVRDLLGGTVQAPVREVFEPELVLRDSCAQAQR
jgi:DNA-binding LacI/PurR family transcriptional regulator